MTVIFTMLRDVDVTIHQLLWPVHIGYIGMLLTDDGRPHKSDLVTQYAHVHSSAYH
jgi:hypothetical protein